MLTLLLTHDSKFGISKEEGIPWKFKEEFDYFAEKINAVESKKALLLTTHEPECLMNPLLINLHVPIYLVDNLQSLQQSIDDCLQKKVQHIFIHFDILLIQQLLIHYRLSSILTIQLSKDYDCNAIVVLNYKDYHVEQQWDAEVLDTQNNMTTRAQFTHYTYNEL